MDFRFVRAFKKSADKMRFLDMAFFNFRPDRFPSVSETSEYRKPIGKIV